MKKLIVLLILFFILPVLVWAGPGYMVFDSNAVPAGCAESCSGTYGNTWEDGTSTTMGANEFCVERIQLTGSCAGSNPTVYIAVMNTSASGVDNIKFVIYSDNAGEPGDLIWSAVAGQTIADDTLHWLDEAVTGGTCLSGYAWVGVVGDGLWNMYFKNTGPCKKYTGNYASPPDPWPTESDTDSNTTRGIYLSW